MDNKDDKDKAGALERNKEMLSYDVLKSVSDFLKENAEAVEGIDMRLWTKRPTMTMTEDGKVHTGRVVLCTVSTWSSADEYDDMEGDGE